MSFKYSRTTGKSTNTVTFLGIDHLHLAVKEVSSHEKLKGNFRRNRELGNLSGGIGVPGLVSEIHADFLKDMAWDLTEVNLVCFILCELARPRQHSLDGPGGESVISSHHELMPITADQLYIHSIRTLTTTIYLLSCVHGVVCGTHLLSSLVEVNQAIK